MRSFRAFLELHRGNRPRLFAFLGLALLQLLAVAPLPFVVKAIFDDAITGQRAGLLVGLGLLMLALHVLSVLVGLAASAGLLAVTTRAVERLRQRVFDKLYALSIRFHETTPIGDIHDRVVHETERVELMTGTGFVVAVPSAIFAIGILLVLAVIDWALFLVTLVFVPIMWAVNRVTRRALRRATQRAHASVEQLSSVTLGGLRTMRETRILAAEPQARARQDVATGEAADAAFRRSVLLHSHRGANRLVIAIWVVLILALGGTAVIDQRLTLGDLFAFYAGLALIRLPIQEMVNSVPMIVAGVQALARVQELLDMPHTRPYTGERQVEITGRLTIEHVTFGYEEGRPVLTDVSIQVRPGAMVALMGPNGSGKTTLANLVLGLYKPAAGHLAIDGVEYREIDMQHLRRQFGVVTQDPIMIPGSIRDNITYGRPGVSPADVERAVELAGAGPLVNGLDAGLDTRAYEGAPLLSGGQMQRVALARAMLGRPRVLILDEPTTHLDVDGLERLLAGLRSVDDPPATLLITHEHEVAAMADSIYHLENGRLIRAVDQAVVLRQADEPDVTSA